MARLCIRIAANNHPTNAALTPLRTRPGDVVALVDDGHVFSDCERNNGQYRIIDLPGVPQEDLVHLVTPRFDANNVMTRRYNQTLDISAISAGAWRNRTSATKAQIDAVTIARA